MYGLRNFFRIIASTILIILIFSQNSFSSDGQSITLDWTRISIGFYTWSYKIFTLLIGYLIAKLGYNLLIKGISGEFKFSADLKGAKADLASVSPGLFFIFMAAVIISICLYKGLDLSSIPDQSTNGQEIVDIAHPPNNPFK